MEKPARTDEWSEFPAGGKILVSTGEVKLEMTRSSMFEPRVGKVKY